MRQNIVEYNMQGAIAELPAGELRFAAGVGGRENRYEFKPDPLNSQESVLDQLAGFFPVGDADGKTEATELYGELLVPAAWPTFGVHASSISSSAIARRITSPSNDVDTWKALLDWQVVDRVRVRGGRQVANRAPNIGELFQSQEQFAPFSQFSRRPVLGAQSRDVDVHG